MDDVTAKNLFIGRTCKNCATRVMERRTGLKPGCEYLNNHVLSCKYCGNHDMMEKDINSFYPGDTLEQICDMVEVIANK